MSASQAGKGDSPRPVDPVKFRENYDRIFKKGMATVDDFKDAEGIKSDPLSILERAFGCKQSKPYTTLDAIAREGCQANIARLL